MDHPSLLAHAVQAAHVRPHELTMAETFQSIVLPIVKRVHQTLQFCWFTLCLLCENARSDLEVWMEPMSIYVQPYAAYASPIIALLKDAMSRLTVLLAILWKRLKPTIDEAPSASGGPSTTSTQFAVVEERRAYSAAPDPIRRVLEHSKSHPRMLKSAHLPRFSARPGA